MVAPYLNAYTSPTTCKVWNVEYYPGSGAYPGSNITLGGLPSGWNTAGFSDSGWAAPIDVGAVTFGLSNTYDALIGTPVSPSRYVAPTEAPNGPYNQGLDWLARMSFYLPSLPTQADLFLNVDNSATTYSINGTTPTSLGGSAIDPAPFVVGWNVLAVRIVNGTSPASWAGGNPTMAIARLYTDVPSGVPTPPAPPLVFQICGPDGTGCVIIERATAKKIRAEYNGTGSGAFQISRYDVQATNAILTAGNIVRVTFAEIDPNPIFEFILETGDFTLISSDEEGGELLSFGGRGTLALLAYAELGHQWLDLAHPKLNFPSEGVWRWTSEEAAGIIRRIIGEAQLHTPPALTSVVHGGNPSPWTDLNDSLGNPFYDMAGTWEIPIGTDLLTAALDLARAGMIQLEMRPGFSLWAYDEQGSDKSGAFGAATVRFEKGVNIGGFDSTELVRQISNEHYTSNVLIHTKTGYLWYNGGVTTPAYVKESFLDLSGTSHTNDQERAAARAMLRGTEEGQSVLLEVTPTGPNGEKNAPTLGYYYPGFASTANGKYWLGDRITLHTGTNSSLDFQNTTFRIYAITLYEDETGAVAPPIIELNAQFTPSEDSGGGSSGGGSTSEGGSTSTSPVNAPHTHSQYQVQVDDKWHQPVRVATTANVTISTALNAGDAIDGVTLAAGDRVLVKDQSTGSQNGIYVAGVTPVRAVDFDDDDEVMGSVVLVIAGTANAGKVFRVTNTTVPVVGTNSISFAETGAGAPTGADYLVGTAQAGLSAEIVVGTTPGGELGGTWASPTVDATHSGSAHFVDPMTTRGDIIIRNASNATARLGRGSASQVLTSDGTDVAWAVGGGGSGALTFISETLLAADAATLDVTGIPATYRDLVIKILSRTSDAVEVGALRLQVGGASIDTGANYGYERRYDGTGSASAGGASGVTYADVGMVAGANSSANSFSSTTVEIFAYTDTSIFRMMETASQHFGVDRYTNHGGAAWRDVTSAIAKLRMSLAAGNYKTGTRITVYGRG